MNSKIADKAQLGQKMQMLLPYSTIFTTGKLTKTTKGGKREGHSLKSECILLPVSTIANGSLLSASTSALHYVCLICKASIASHPFTISFLVHWLSD